MLEVISSKGMPDDIVDRVVEKVAARGEQVKRRGQSDTNTPSKVLFVHDGTDEDIYNMIDEMTSDGVEVHVDIHSSRNL